MEPRTEELVFTMTKTELIAELEGYRDIIVHPDEFTWQKLADKLRYYRCANCIDYETRKLCHTCTKEIIYEYDDFYEE